MVIAVYLRKWHHVHRSGKIKGEHRSGAERTRIEDRENRNRDRINVNNREITETYVDVGRRKEMAECERRLSPSRWMDGQLRGIITRGFL